MWPHFTGFGIWSVEHVQLWQNLGSNAEFVLGGPAGNCPCWDTFWGGPAAAAGNPAQGVGVPPRPLYDRGHQRLVPIRHEATRATAFPFTTMATPPLWPGDSMPPRDHQAVPRRHRIGIGDAQRQFVLQQHLAAPLQRAEPSARLAPPFACLHCSGSRGPAGC